VRQTKSVCDSHGQFADTQIKKYDCKNLEYAGTTRISSAILAGSDFFLFGHLKSQMIGRKFDSPEDLIRWIQAAFLRISSDTIERVFDEWIDRAERCILYEGSYFPEE
jgi:hypothetical protein